MHTFTDLDNNSVKFVFVFPRFYLELIYTTEQFLQINYVKVIIKLRHVTEIESIILGGQFDRYNESILWNLNSNVFGENSSLF